MPEWFEDESFWIEMFPYMFPKKRFETAGEQAEKVEVEWVLEDMRNFKRLDNFDLVINMFTSFGFFDNIEEDIAVLRKIYANLKQGGVFVIDMMGKEKLARIFKPATATREDDGSLLVQLHETLTTGAVSETNGF